MPRVLCLVSHYLPGYKAGGALRSVANLVATMGRAWDFRIVTSDRDLGDAARYPGIERDTWSTVGPARVWYASGGWREIARVVRDTPTDVLYLNSFFDARYSIAPLLAARRRRDASVPVVLAPRGEFSPGALRLKRLKKRLYIAAARRSALYRGVVWHASTPLEADDIRRELGATAADVRIAPDLVAASPAVDPGVGPPDDRRPLRIAFVSRLSAKKNLPFALEVLNAVTVPVEFDVYGPAEDPVHLDRCRRLAAALPPNVQVSFHGPVAHGEVARVLARSHVLLFPTLGENFGHVIAEALSVGTPVLISDQTPWRGLRDRGAGWDLPLDDPAAFAAAIGELAAMDGGSYRAMRDAARGNAATLVPPATHEEMTRLFFGNGDIPPATGGGPSADRTRQAAES